MMFKADKAYSRMISDGQQIFMQMRKEYDELLGHCRELSRIVSAQGQEIYGDGRRIDELDHYLSLTTQRADQLGSQNQNMKDEHASLSNRRLAS